MFFPAPPSSRSRTALPALITALVVLGVAPAANADVVTLRSLEARAVIARQNIQGRAARVGIAQAEMEEVRAENRPVFSFGVDGTAAPGGRLIQFSEGGHTYYVRGSAALQSGQLGQAFAPNLRYAAHFDLQGTLYDFGRTRARVEGGRYDVAAAEAEIAAVREDVVRAVRAAYLAWYGAYETRRFAELSLADSEDRVRRMQENVGEGARSRFDVESAELEAARLRLELSRAEAEEDDARLLLGQAVGEALPENAEPDPTIVAIEPPPESDPNPRMARALELRRDASVAATQIYKLRYAPILTGLAQLGINGQLSTFGPSLPFPVYQMMLGLTVPLWDPKAGDYLVGQARSQAAELSANVYELRATALVNSLRARSRFEHASHQVTLATDMLRMSERSATSSEERWQIAGGPFEAVLTARERVRRAHQDLVRAQLDRTEAALRLTPVD